MKKTITFLKSFFYQANLNFENMQGSGFKYLISDLDSRNDLAVPQEELDRQSEYFHTHPFFIGFILGVWVKEYRQHGKPDFYKKIYASAFGALGDSFFWHSLRPFSFVLAAIVGMIHPMTGLVTYIVLFNLFHLGFQFLGFDIGYLMGKDVIEFFNRIRFSRWPGYFDLSTAFLLGIFLSMFVKRVISSEPLAAAPVALVLLAGIFIGKRFDIATSLKIVLTGVAVVLFAMGG